MNMSEIEVTERKGQEETQPRDVEHGNIAADVSPVAEAEAEAADTFHDRPSNIYSRQDTTSSLGLSSEASSSKDILQSDREELHRASSTLTSNRTLVSEVSWVGRNNNNSTQDKHISTVFSNFPHINGRESSTHPPNPEDRPQDNNNDHRDFYRNLSTTRNRSHPRLVKRNMPHYQSLNKVSISKSEKIRLVRSNTMSTHISPLMHRFFYRFFPEHWVPTHWSLFQRDWFHTFLRWPTKYSLTLLVGLWTLTILVFAGIYLAEHRAATTDTCRMAVGSLASGFGFYSAFAFSLETATTVGYTLPPGTNFFFQHCPGVNITIYFQMLLSLFYNAFLLAFLFTRIARTELRASQVMFSNKAILKPVTYDEGKGDGQVTRWTLEIRIFDLDAQHPIVEAHVRLYASFLPENQHLQVCRLLRPDDSYNGWVYTSVPFSVVHEVDIFSPLCPPHGRKLLNEHKKWFIGWNGMERRDADSRIENSMGWVCPVCAQGSGELGRLMRHIRYMKSQDTASNMPIEGTHREIADEFLEPVAPFMNSVNEEMLRKHLAHVEIICVVEGIDPITSGTFQALQSYTMEDIVFQDSFKPCVGRERDNVVVDLDAFHKTQSFARSFSDSGEHATHLKYR